MLLKINFKIKINNKINKINKRRKLIKTRIESIQINAQHPNVIAKCISSIGATTGAQNKCCHWRARAIIEHLQVLSWLLFAGKKAGMINRVKRERIDYVNNYGENNNYLFFSGWWQYSVSNLDPSAFSNKNLSMVGHLKSC